MALVKFGNGLWIPPLPRSTTALTEASTTALTATGHKVAFLGRMWNKDGTTKTLVGVGLCFGTIVKAGGSGLTISQQGIDHATGPAYQPDGTQAQTWAVATGNASFATSTWLNTSDNAGVSIAFGAEIAIVVEYDGSGRLGSDSVPVRGMTAAETGPYAAAGTVMYNGTTWTAQSVVPNLTLKFSDGTYGTIDGAVPHSAIATLTIGSASATQDEVGLEFTVPAACKVDAVWCGHAIVSGADYEILLYSGTTALATVATDGNAIVAATTRFGVYPFTPVTLATSTTYRIAIRPTTTTTMTTYALDVNTADHRQALPGFGTDGAYVTRLDQGAWAATTTTRAALMGLRLSHIDDGTGSGGSGAIKSRIFTGY